MKRAVRAVFLCTCAFLLLLLSPAAVSNASVPPGPCPGPWIARASVPYNARGIFAASDGTYVYAGGGFDGTNVHNDLLRFDPATNTWSSLASSPDGHLLSPAVYSPVTNKVYNFGGFGSVVPQTNTTRIYDVATNTWSTGAPMPAALADHAAVLDNGIVYIAGGYNGTTSVNTLYAYNIAGNSWSTLAPMPQALYLPGFGAINGKVYIASGNTGSGELSTLYIYDISGNSWSTGPTIPVAVTGPGSAVFQGQLYVFGGGFPTTKTNTQVFDPVANSWSPGPPILTSKLWFYGAAFATGILALGGDHTPGIPINDNERLNCNSGISGLSPAKLWIGLANSDDVGIRFDLQATVSKNGTPIGSGSLNSVPGGSSGFNNAILDSITLALSSSVPVSSGDTLSIEVSARNACSGSGKNSGRARLWYNGQPVDSGATRDAGSRFDATINGTNNNDFLRTGDTLSTTAGSARTFKDVSVGAKCGPFVSFGTWSTALP